MPVWEKDTMGDRIHSYNIYREGAVVNQFDSIGNVFAWQPGIFVDQQVNPAQRSYRYRISARDSCGNTYFFPSATDIHKTLFLQSSVGVSGEVNLSWNAYEGYTPPTYYIHRGFNVNNFSILDSVPSTTTTYTDFNPQIGLNFYRISFKNQCSIAGPQIAYIARSNNSGVNVDGLDISGTILSAESRPVMGVTVLLTGDDTGSFTTAADGRYNFQIRPGGTYTITPSKNNDVVANNGITAADILLMRRHILGIAPLGSPYKIIAAAECNAAGDTLVSTTDILLTRQLILGNATGYPANRLWQFVPSDYVFPDAINPFPFPTTRTYTNITTNQTGQDFIGIKLGDVNNSWGPSIP